MKVFIYASYNNKFIQKLCSFTNLIFYTSRKPDSTDIFFELNNDNELILNIPNFTPFNVNKYYLKLLENRKNLSNELIIKVLKSIKNKEYIFDVTAGLGKDAFIISNFGFPIILIEHNLILATILYFAYLQKLLPCKNVIFADSIKFLQKNHIKYNIIYFDPMFNSEKKALPKKEMQIIQVIQQKFHKNYDFENFKHNLLKNKNKTLIIKSKISVDPIPNRIPHFIKKGKLIKFSVYNI